MTQMPSGEELFLTPCWKEMPSEQPASIWDSQILSAYNPSIIERLLPDIRRLPETAMDKHEFYDSRVLIEPCPACGNGRTLFVHLASEVGPVVEANFKKWCQPCRAKLARLADNFITQIKNL